MKKYETWKSGERLYIKFYDEPSLRIIQSLKAMEYEPINGRSMLYAGVKDQDYVTSRLRSWASHSEWRKNGKRSGTLCWDCGNAYGGCSWSINFTPVKGWDAQYVQRVYKGRDVYVMDSYEVRSCPEFVLDGRCVV